MHLHDGQGQDSPSRRNSRVDGSGGDEEGGGVGSADNDCESHHSPRRGSFIQTLRRNTVDMWTPHTAHTVHTPRTPYASAHQMEQVCFDDIIYLSIGL
jgi:hypothetical protein